MMLTLMLKFFTWLTTPVTKLLNSFDNFTKHSYSGRKLTAFAFTGMVGYVVWGYVEHHAEHNFVDVFWVIIALIIGVFVALGLVTIPQMIQILNAKNGKEVEETKTTTETTDNSETEEVKEER